MEDLLRNVIKVPAKKTLNGGDAMRVTGLSANFELRYESLKSQFS